MKVQYMKENYKQAEKEFKEIKKDHTKHIARDTGQLALCNLWLGKTQYFLGKFKDALNSLNDGL